MTRTIIPAAPGRPAPDMSRGFLPLRAVSAAAARVQDWAAATEAHGRTTRVLAGLAPAGWTFAHDVRLTDGHRIEHLTAGPGGVFVLVSKVWHGVVTVDHKGATITPACDTGSAWTARGPHRSLLPAASAVRRALSAHTGTPAPAPRAVVVVWAPFPERVTVCGGVAYVAGERLADWLQEQPSLSAPGTPLAPVAPKALTAIPRPRTHAPFRTTARRGAVIR